MKKIDAQNKEEELDLIIAKLKEENPNRPLFAMDLFSQTYIFTYLTGQDARELADWTQKNAGKASAADLDEKIVDMALLYPEISPIERQLLPAGVFPALSRQIQVNSLYDISDHGLLQEPQVTTLVPYEEAPELTTDVLETLLQNKKYPLMSVSVCNYTFVIRPILRAEFNSIRKQSTLGQMVDEHVEVAEKCTVFPTSVNWMDIPAGVPSLLAGYIYTMSGFDDNAKVREL